MFKMKYSSTEWKRAAIPKYLFHIATKTEKDQYTLIEQSEHLVLLKLVFTNTTQLYN